MSKKALIQELNNKNIDDLTDVELEIKLLEKIGDFQ